MRMNIFLEKKERRNKMDKSNRRKNQTRLKLRKNSSRNRLSVFKSNYHIYVQVINDNKGITLASASSLEKIYKDKVNISFNSFDVD